MKVWACHASGSMTLFLFGCVFNARGQRVRNIGLKQQSSQFSRRRRFRVRSQRKWVVSRFSTPSMFSGSSFPRTPSPAMVFSSRQPSHAVADDAPKNHENLSISSEAGNLSWRG